ncbi:peptidase domain-containing ABC transporter [Dyadobacter sp. LHD-138]|uniref:peptidase domain-containing ABC transporter n=1 Tax=Dyadobacter sp. LHD-138 TaxID=3071413 RepID=UPI0027DEC43C|nr:peptidase domain-containing ABC transporter [Dyadobacter sp. LHD-138]MDQ6477423.1 peptidase domain-containing ABC transporter [Dyadobacter sp. LHD-138]
MRASIFIKQHDITDCGAACLASVAGHYGLGMPIARVRQYAGTDQKGTNVLGLIEAAQKIGFQAKGVKGALESLNKIPLPAIAHVIVKGGLHHYIVIYKVTDKDVTYMDPGDGKIHTKALEEFKKLWTGVLIILLPADNFVIENQRVSVLRRFWALVNPHKSVMIQALFGAAVATLLGLSTSIYIQKITDHVLPSGNMDLLRLLSVGMLLILVLQTVVGTIKTVFVFKTGQQIDAQLILGYYKHLLTLPQQFFDTMRVGEIISRVNDAVKIRSFINETVLDLVVNVFIVLFSFMLMFTYYWKLALIMLAIIPFYVFFYWISNRINKRLQRKLMENGAELEAQLVESLNAASTIKRFGMEAYANYKTETRFIQLIRTIYSSFMSSLSVSTASGFISQLFTIILLWVGTSFVITNALTAGELFSFYALIGYFTGPAGRLIGANKTIQDALIAADRLFEIMDLEREKTEHKIELTEDMVGDIRLEDVTFRYGTRAIIFEHLNLTIRKGKITAIVGESGSGKSTLISLLQNLYPLKSGRINIGDFDVQHLSNESLRKLVSVVPQQIHLFAATVLENIALGAFEPDMKKILYYARKLGIHEFIEALPNGYVTELAENGSNLSGGQRQRLAILRALYREPEIIIFDEATSSLDTISERYVQDTIKSLCAAGKTVVLIAHRLSTVREADEIIVVHKGKVIEKGTHETLLVEKGQYASLWSQQSGVTVFETNHVN